MNSNNEVNDKEDFLEETVENFHDYIQNLIYSMQKYVNNINKAIYMYIKRENMKNMNPEFTDINAFLFSESENIMMMKCLKFVIDSSQMLLSKFRLLTTKISDPKNVNYRYGYSSKGLAFFKSSIRSIDFEKLTGNTYGRAEDNNAKMFDFTGYMTSCYEFYNKMKFDTDVRDITGEELLLILNEQFNDIHATMIDLKHLAEKSKSPIVSSMIAKEAINLMIMVYRTVLYIKITNK